MTSADDSRAISRSERSVSVSGRAVPIAAGVLALAMAVYGVVGTVYIGFTRISFSNLEGLPGGKRSATDALAVLLLAVIMIVYGLGAVLMLRHRPVGRRIVLVVSAFSAVFAAAGSANSADTRGVLLLVGDIVGVVLLILIFFLSWSRPTRGWVSNASGDRGTVSETPRSTQFRFLVDSVFAITGRGTTVIGVIEAGTISIGDQLRVMKADGQLGPTATCTAVEGVHRADWTPEQPAPLGLIVPELRTSEIAAGDRLVSEVDNHGS